MTPELKMMILLLAPLAALCIIVLAANFASERDFRYYREIYKSLPGRKFYRNRSQVYSHALGEKNDGFIWFYEQNDFVLKDGVYLFDASFTYLSPYSWYWLKKYQRWFKENVDVNKLPIY